MRGTGNPSVATPPRHPGIGMGDTESGGEMLVTNRLVNLLSGALAACVICMPLGALPALSAASCSALKKEISK